jgi:hypothetical protein
MTFGNRQRASEEILSLRRRMSLSYQFRASNRGCLGNFDLPEEAVAVASNGFQKAGTLGRVAEGVTDFVYGLVESVFEIHESACGPEFLLKFLASHDLAGVLKEHPQHLEGLFLKPDS